MEIRIINVLEIIDGIPSTIESFIIWEEQLREEVVGQAEELFKELVFKNSSINIEDEEELEKYVEDGFFENSEEGYKVYLIWSN